MKLALLIASAMTAVLMIVHIIEQRYSKKRYAAIARRMEKRVKDGNWKNKTSN